MDYIHIDRLLLKGKHGVNPKERIVEQEFEISLRMEVGTHAAAQSDALKDTVDYGPIRSKVATIVEGSSVYLLEKLAERIASGILEDKRIGAVMVTIRKTEVWDNGVPGITIERKNT